MHPATFLNQHPVFTTREYALLCGKGIDSASRSLNNLAREAAITRVTRGIWMQPQNLAFTPNVLIPYLLGTEQGYLSFLSAMHLHGLLGQIPVSIQIATTGHARGLSSQAGYFEFIHLKPVMMTSGVTAFDVGNTFYPLATPEKALLDTLYIATRRGNRFASLPELNCESLNAGIFYTLLKEQVPAQPISVAIRKRAAEIGLPGM